MASSSKSSRNKQFVDITDSLNSRLPIALTVNDVESSPEFVKLLEALTQNITPTGATFSSERHLAETKELLDRQKRRWLLNQTLLAEIRELLLDHRLQPEQSPPSADSQFYKTVDEMLTYAEISDYVNCSPDPVSDVTLLGLTAEKLDRMNPYKKHKQSMQQRLIPDVESRLRRQCEALVSFHDLPTADSNDASRFDFAKATQLPGIIAAEKQSLFDEKKQLQKDVADSRKLRRQYMELMMQSAERLVKLLIDHRLKSQPEYDSINSEWLAARCDAMCLKIRVLESQLLYDTYYPDTVQALTTIRAELDKSIASTERELERTTQALRAYEAVGSTFESIVQEFTRLRAEVENRRWALHELKKNSGDTHSGPAAAGDADRTFFS